jgi:hypothetical protein
VIDLAIGFGLAMYLGGHYHTIRKFGLPILWPFKMTPSGVGESPQIPAKKDEMPASADES